MRIVGLCASAITSKTQKVFHNHLNLKYLEMKTKKCVCDNKEKCVENTKSGNLTREFSKGKREIEQGEKGNLAREKGNFSKGTREI